MKVRKLSPRQLETLQGAIALHNQGRLEEADAIYSRFLRDVPAHPDALHLRALVAHARGEYADAARLAEAAIAQAPGVANFHNTAGEAWRRQGESTRALQRLQEAVRLDPAMAMAHQNLALAWSEGGHHADALAACRRALAIVPASLEARIAQLEVLGRAGDFGAEARAQAARLAGGAPGAARDAAAAYYTRGARARILQQDFEGARADARAAVAASPSFWGGWSLLGEACNELGELAQAELCCTLAANLAPENPDARLNLAHLLREQQRLEEAESHYAAWLADHPADAGARFGRGVSRLGRGEHAGGWPDYESRWSVTGAVDPFARVPRWDGGACAELLVYPEQGLGDFLQMLRFVPEAARRAGGRVTVLAPAPLLRLVRRNLPREIEVLAALPAGARLQRACPIMSLPLALQVHAPQQVAGAGPYVGADAQRSDEFRRLLAAAPGRKLGIVWRGAGGNVMNRRRVLPEAALLPLLALPGWTAVSLQFGVREPSLAGQPLLDLAQHIEDFEDLAAAMAAVDAVVSLDTGPAHLAGAMGLPCHTLLPRLHDWRWGPGGSRCTWYPAMTLLRQDEHGCWDAAVQQLVGALGGAPSGVLPAAPAAPRAVERNAYPYVQVRGRDGAFVVPLENPVVGRCLLAYGEHLPRLAQILGGYLRPGDTAIDLGAGLGTLAVPLARAVGAQGRVLAVEGDQQLHDCLSRTIELNALAQVDVREAMGLLPACRLVAIDSHRDGTEVLGRLEELITRDHPLVCVTAGDATRLRPFAEPLRRHGYTVVEVQEPLWAPGNPRACELEFFEGARMHTLLALPAGTAPPPDAVA